MPLRGLRGLRGPGLIAIASALLAGCGAAPAEVLTPTVAPTAIPSASPVAHAAASPLLDWPEFGLDPQRSSATDASTAITSANLAHLRRVTVTLPGTVDSSPIYLHGVSIGGATHDAIFATTTYGRTVAIAATSGRILWTFTPPGYSSWEGGPRITTSTPVADPGRGFIYAASPNGEIHKLAVADGSEAPGWPVSITRDSTHEKTGAALNIDGPFVIAATSGYYGDAPPYQGHVVLIERSSAHIAAIFNTLCANRRAIIQPSSCTASDSAVLSRGGAVVEPGGARIVLDTGNGPWNGSINFGDSVLELTVPGLRLRQSFTPTNQEQLNRSDTDLGSSAPALLGGNRLLLAGKDGIMRILALSALDGHPAGSSAASRHPLGGEVQRLGIPGGGQLFTAPAVWHHDGRTTVFVADEHGTAAYVLRAGRLYQAWENATSGTSPVLAGGLLYVFEPANGGIEVYRPGSSAAIAKLPGSSGHWNSPIVVDGHVVEPEGDGNDHSTTGTLDIFSAS
jgi:PQQ-like domain